ncbi:nucleoside hydrolase [Oceanobacillus saliphilus]|uniref:nucleoside hydrolase n=1 Tax=Oceanobacillus saliphilus TaxID=2925834 RepID=UPI00201DA0A1|nr:nucleoside hydrolase [Oceanobacillus saliphilus]
MERKVILDCDPGHDDAIAIILAASKISNLKIEAITTVAGNVEVEKNTLNALKVCDIIGLEDVPVAQGAERPLVKEREIAEEIHGETGLDGPVLPKNPTKQVIDKHGVDVIIEKLLNSDNDITLVPTGPLTNIALAMIKEPRIVPKIKEIVLMGGGTFGNWTPAAEFNIYVDAEAAKVVFDSGVPIAMFGLDVTHQAIATDDIVKELSEIENPIADFVIDLLEFFSKTYKEVFGFAGPPIHDACTVAYLIDPSIFELNHVRVDIETKGEFSYGMTVVDTLATTGRDPNVHFAYQLDSDKFWDLMKRALKSY